MVETLAFGGDEPWCLIDGSVPRVVIFRDAILDLFQVELGSKLSTEAYKGWKAMLNYVGGAIIFIKAFYAERIRLLGESWALANDKGANTDKFATLGSHDEKTHEAAEKKAEGHAADHHEEGE